MIIPEAETFTHVRFDTTTAHFVSPGGVQCTTASSTRSKPCPPFHADVTREAWEDERLTTFWHRDSEENILSLLKPMYRDGLWSPNTAAHRYRHVSPYFWTQNPENTNAEGSAVMVTFFRATGVVEDNASDSSDGQADVDGEETKNDKSGPKYSLDDLFSDDEEEQDAESWEAFLALTGGDGDATLSLMEAVDKAATELMKLDPILVCHRCDSASGGASNLKSNLCSAFHGTTANECDDADHASCACLPSALPKPEAYFCGEALTEPIESVDVDSFLADAAEGEARTTHEIGVGDHTELRSSGVQAGATAKELKKPSKPSRLLKPCDEAIKHDEHGPQLSCYCFICQQNAMRDRNHSHADRPVIRLGGLALDLAERPNADCSVQTCLCGVTVERRAKVRKVYVAIPMVGKKKSDLKKALTDLLLRVETIFGSTIVKRSHSDREGAILSMKDDLNGRGIFITTTAGNDSKGNAYGEGAVLMLTRLARISLGQALAKIPKKDRNRVANILWGHAMAHAGDWLSIDQVERFGRNDPPDMVPSMMGTNDITSFLAKCLYRQGGKLKNDRVDPPGIESHYLHPHHLTAVGTKLMVIEEGYHVETQATTVRPVLLNNEFQYPDTFPLKPSRRPAFGRSNDFFSWLQCGCCRKYRCVPKTLHMCLEKWGVHFICKMDENDEGVVRGCDDPEVRVYEDMDKPPGKRGRKQTRKYAGQVPKKAGRPSGVKDKAPRKRKGAAAAPAANPAEATTSLQPDADAQQASGEHTRPKQVKRRIFWTDRKMEAQKRAEVRDRVSQDQFEAMLAEFADEVEGDVTPSGEPRFSPVAALAIKRSEDEEFDAVFTAYEGEPDPVEEAEGVPSPAFCKDEEEPAARPDYGKLRELYSELSVEAKERVQNDSAAAFARMCRLLRAEPEQITNRTSEAFHALLDWFSSEEAILMDEEYTRSGNGDEPIELGEYEVVKYRAGDSYAEVAEAMAADRNDTVRSYQKNALEKHRSHTEAASRRPAEKSLGNTSGEFDYLKSRGERGYADAHVYEPLRLKDCRSRPDYTKTVGAEIGRMINFECWGKPVARGSIPDAAWVYRVNMLYGIKNAEVPDKRKDKARLVLMGNLRFTKTGKLLLDKWFRSPGEYWAPASSMSGFRFVAAVAVILGLPLETIDLDSAYLQTHVRGEATDYLELVPEVIEAMTDDWQEAIRLARLKDEEIRKLPPGMGEVVFPLLKNMYGKTPSGKNFIEDLQTNLTEGMEWMRMPHCPGTFLKFCPKTKLPMLIANYVDDFAAVMTDESRDAEWGELAKTWTFDPPRRCTRFLALETYYPSKDKDDKINLRHMVMHQCEYVTNTVVKRYEKAAKVKIGRLKHLPMEEPEWPEEDFRNEAGTIVRSAVGGLAYAARGSRPDLMKAFHTLSRRVTKWTQAAGDFLRKVLAFCKETTNRGINMDARGTSRNLSDWQIDTSVDASHFLPWCQSGFMMTFTPVSCDDSTVKPPFLAVDWVSNGQSYTKLAPAESETVGLVQAARGGLKYKFSYDDMVGGLVDRPMIVRVDNTQAKLFVERGWSPTMAHLVRVYAINVLWVTERIQEGLIKTVYENTKLMLADPLTKMNDAKVYQERGVMSVVPMELLQIEADDD